MLAVLATLLIGAPQALATPEPGRYSGILRITKTLPPYYSNALSTTTTIKVVAEVVQNARGRSLTVLAEVTEPPIWAFYTETSVIRGVFQVDGSCVVHGPPFQGVHTGASNYRCSVTESETPLGFIMRHDNIPLGINFFVDPHLTQAITDFEYRLLRVRQ
jgi:hypothetical protein